MLKLIYLVVNIAWAIRPLDEYVSAEDPNYGWYEVDNSTFHSAAGGTGYVLNVTS
jgi:hypothetical protein